MKKEKEKTTKEDLIYRLQEMSDSMQDSLKNIDKVKEEQKGLIEIIEKSDRYEDYKDFIEELKKQIDSMSKQKENLEKRANLLKELLFGIDKEILTARSAVNGLLVILNVFGENQ